MADGGYQRTCTRCNRTWLVPSDIAEERPDFKAAASQYLSLIGGKHSRCSIGLTRCLLGQVVALPRGGGRCGAA